MPSYKNREGLQVDSEFSDFFDAELLPLSGLSAERFWSGFDKLIAHFAPKNGNLLKKRDQLQAKIDAWHSDGNRAEDDARAYKEFLYSIGYLVPEQKSFAIDTSNVDAEIAEVAGPQLVVPVMNARFALNACNARWGSLYDALYGTDAIPWQGYDRSLAYDPKRGEAVIAYARGFLDETFPLSNGSWSNLSYCKLNTGQLFLQLVDGSQSTLKNPASFVAYKGDFNANNASVLLLKNHGLHVEIHFDAKHPVAKTDTAGISDVILEAAITTIMDCEDSVAAVDAEDKILVYRNWLGLMQGSLQQAMNKNGKSFVRRMNVDRNYTTLDGSTITLPGRSTMFVRNVGLLMTSNIILDREGNEIPEGILDVICTVVAALPDILDTGTSDRLRNSRCGSIYIVKPKMHGPEEVAFCNELFEAVESLLNLPINTIKMGIMDEERRTSVNLKECIRAAKSRVAFINTGFLDRTGDEIHSSMEAGAFAPKADIKGMPWINAYEQGNVGVGLACGLQGKAQIGKGMWAMPDNMFDMLKQKIAQLKAGASTAWVPSPTAATLHAMHYHKVDVHAEQNTLKGKTVASDVDTILCIPLLGERTLSEEEIQRELENNAQGILGYVVRWIDQGIGCSKVPDIDNLALMEDRATLRISSQHLANWLHHGLCSQDQVMQVFKQMAVVVDKQNANDPHYQPMAENFEKSIAFKAACDLVFLGRQQPNGYTEPLLHAYREKRKHA